MKNKNFFPKRIREPKKMDTKEEQAFNEFMRKNYERIFYPFVDELLEKSKLQKGVIADLGCGAGLLVRALAERRKKINVIGVDLSDRMLEEAKKECENLLNAEFVKSDVLHLKFQDNTFDLVISKDSFHEFPNPLKVLGEMRRIVKLKHWVCIQDLRRDLPMRLLNQALPRQNTFQKLQYQSIGAAYTKKEMQNFLEKLGVTRYSIKTRLITEKVRRAYKNRFDLALLKGSFQARYSLWFQKESSL